MEAKTRDTYRNMRDNQSPLRFRFFRITQHICRSFEKLSVEMNVSPATLRRFIVEEISIKRTDSVLRILKWVEEKEKELGIVLD